MLGRTERETSSRLEIVVTACLKLPISRRGVVLEHTKHVTFDFSALFERIVIC